jgi:hypothetical protein
MHADLRQADRLRARSRNAVRPRAERACAGGEGGAAEVDRGWRG